MPKILIMKDEKWVLPSKEAYNAGLSNVLRHDDDEIDLRKGELNKKCRLLAESDLTAALDILASLVADERPCRADSVHTIKMFLQQFKHPTP